MGSNYKEDLIVRIKSTFRTENTASLVMDVERTERVLLWPIETPALKCGFFSAGGLPAPEDGWGTGSNRSRGQLPTIQ